MRGLHHSERTPNVCGYSMATDAWGDRWGESLQVHIDAAGESVPREDAAQDRMWWNGQEAHVVARITRKRVTDVQLTRHPPLHAEAEHNEWV